MYLFHYKSTLGNNLYNAEYDVMFLNTALGPCTLNLK